MQPEYKYYAFISYNWKDLEWGKKLQKKLEVSMNFAHFS